MDFKSLLQSMDNISETVHKAGPGGYGNRHGTEAVTDQYGKKIGKVSLASLGPKDDTPAKRGRPVDPDKPKTGKDDPKNKKVGDIFGRTTGDVPKGKKGTKVSKMADADKAEKKSLKDWIEASEQNQLNEEDVSLKPIQASQIIGSDGKAMGTADTATANAIKSAAEKGTLNLSGDDSSSTSSSSQPMTEKFDKPVKTDPSEKGKYKGKSKSELLKAYNHLKKTGPHEKGSKQFENMKELAFAIRAKGDWGKVKEEQVEEGGYRGRDAYSRDEYSATTGFDKKDSLAYQQDGGANDEGWEDEKPRYPRTSDRMRQAQQRHYGFKPPRSESIEEGNDGNLANNAKPYKKVTQRDVIQGAQGKDEMGGKKKKVAEARVMEESEYTYEKIGKILSQENPTLDANSDEFISAVYHEMIQMGMTPKSAHNKLSYDEDFLGDVATSYTHYIKHGAIDEDGAPVSRVAPTTPTTTAPARIASPGWGRDPVSRPSAPAMGTIKGGVWTADPPKPGERGVPAPTDPEGVREGNFLSTLGQPKKTFESKNMKDIQLESWEKELNSLLNLNEGITVSSSTGQQGSPDSVSVNATDADAQQLLQVLRSAGVGVFGGEQEHSNYGAPMHDQEPTGTGTEPEMSPEVVGDGDDMLSLIKKMSGIQDSGMQGSEEPDGVAVVDFSSEEGSEDDEQAKHGSDNHSHEEHDDEGSKEEKGEEVTDEGNAFGNEVRQKKSDNIPDSQQRITTGGQNLPVKEQGHDHEEGGTCNECGMFEARCVCEPGEEQVEEDYANEAGHEEMASLKHLLNVGNDMHKPKEHQSVGNPTKVTFETKLLKDSTSLLQDYRKLSGIK